MLNKKIIVYRKQRLTLRILDVLAIQLELRFIDSMILLMFKDLPRVF